MDWSYSSRGKVSALQVQSPKFKPQSHQKKKKKNPKLLNTFYKKYHSYFQISLEQANQIFSSEDQKGNKSLTICLLMFLNF
jgi:hypothetical protein